MSKIFGNVVAISETKSGTPGVRLSLYTGKNQDGSYRESTMVDLVGKSLEGLAVKDRVVCEVGHLEESIFTRKTGEKGAALRSIAFSATKADKAEAITVRGNLVADSEASPNGKPKFRIGVNHKDKDGNAHSAFYSVLVAKGDGEFKKGDFVEVAGILTLTIGKQGDRVFRDIIAFSAEKVEKAPDAGGAYPADADDDEELPF